jgi:SagB-type dehydrogenase family enzyme
VTNSDTDEARRFHEFTKHTYESVRANRDLLDWENQPRPFKRYRGLERIELNAELPRFGVSALTAISTVVAPPDTRPLDMSTLAYLLFYAAGITRRRRYAGGEVAFRAASCTGALYEIDLYVVARAVGGLPPGVYHFDPEHFTLSVLRRGDFGGALCSATADEPGVAQAAAALVCSGTYWRNAWKYRDRTYRHFGWDGGTILANLTAAAAAAGISAKIVSGFVDREIDALLGLESAREVSLALVPLGRAPAAAGGPAAPATPLGLATEAYSERERDFPAMRRIHEASSLDDDEAVSAWRASAQGAWPKPAAAAILPLEPVEGSASAQDAFEDVVRRRGSTRQFDRRAAWTFEQLSTALARSLQPISADFAPSGARLNEAYVVVHNVAGLKPGAYVVHREPWGLQTVQQGSFRAEAGYLGLEQELPADASAVVFLLADLEATLERLGNRGYRVSNLEAGLLGGRLYLAAYAQGLGASGLTFYDDDVVSFFGPPARGRSAMFCIALGRSVRRAP